jgi:hypothetical protein
MDGWTCGRVVKFGTYFVRKTEETAFVVVEGGTGHDWGETR